MREMHDKIQNHFKSRDLIIANHAYVRPMKGILDPFLVSQFDRLYTRDVDVHFYMKYLNELLNFFGIPSHHYRATRRILDILEILF